MTLKLVSRHFKRSEASKSFTKCSRKTKRAYIVHIESTPWSVERWEVYQKV
jgi:hypothetical protein